MPARIVWPDSWSRLTWNVGSSSARRWIAMPTFSWSAFLRLHRDLDDRVREGHRLRTIGACGSQSVSPVVVSLRPITA